MSAWLVDPKLLGWLQAVAMWVSFFSLFTVTIRLSRRPQLLAIADDDNDDDDDGDGGGGSDDDNVAADNDDDDKLLWSLV